jgi:hypothetical protein
MGDWEADSMTKHLKAYALSNADDKDDKLLPILENELHKYKDEVNRIKKIKPTQASVSCLLIIAMMSQPLFSIPFFLY